MKKKNSEDRGQNSDAPKTVEGRVVELLPSGLYRVDLDGRADIVVHPAGAAVMNAMRLRAGDRVEVAVSPNDHHRGRITKLLRKT